MARRQVAFGFRDSNADRRRLLPAQTELRDDPRSGLWAAGMRQLPPPGFGSREPRLGGRQGPRELHGDGPGHGRREHGWSAHADAQAGVRRHGSARGQCRRGKRRDAGRCARNARDATVRNGAIRDGRRAAGTGFPDAGPARTSDGRDARHSTGDGVHGRIERSRIRAGSGERRGA